jgi:hypothetical protein
MTLKFVSLAATLALAATALAVPATAQDESM